jgi:hypothetical protein
MREMIFDHSGVPILRILQDLIVELKRRRDEVGVMQQRRGMIAKHGVSWWGPMDACELALDIPRNILNC